MSVLVYPFDAMRLNRRKRALRQAMS